MTRTRSPAAHPAGDVAAASDEVAAWLAPWVMDQAEGATVNEILGLLLETARDPSLLTWEHLAKHRVVHPADFIRENRDRLDVHEDGDSWILRHRDDRSIPLRLRRGARDGWELMEPVLDDDALRAAARRRDPADALAKVVGAMTLGAGLGERRTTTPQLMGAVIDRARVASSAAGDDLTCTLIEWSGRGFFDATLGAAVVGLLRSSAGLNVQASLLQADPERWRVWVAQRDRDASASVALIRQAGHCALRWVVCAPGGIDDARALLAEALHEEAAYADALSTSAWANDLALSDLLVGIGYRTLGPIDGAHEA
jgi:hypothetical protein